MTQRLDLALAPDELRQTSARRPLEARPKWPETDDLVDVDRLVQTLYPELALAALAGNSPRPIGGYAH